MNAYELAHARKLLADHGYVVTNDQTNHRPYVVKYADGAIVAYVTSHDMSDGTCIYEAKVLMDYEPSFRHRFDPGAGLVFIACQMLWKPYPEGLWNYAL